MTADIVGLAVSCLRSPLYTAHGHGPQHTASHGSAPLPYTGSGFTRRALRIVSGISFRGSDTDHSCWSSWSPPPAGRRCGSGREPDGRCPLWRRSTGCWGVRGFFGEQVIGAMQVATPHRWRCGGSGTACFCASQSPDQ